MTARAFDQDLVQGKVAEQDRGVRAFLALLYPGAEVSPATLDLDLDGIDLVVHTKPFPVGVQVKRYSGRLRPLRTALIFLEDFSDFHRAVPGWLWTSRAEILAVRYQDACLAFHLPTLRTIAEARRDKWKGYYRTNYSQRGRARWRSTYWAVPLAEVLGALLDPTGTIKAALKAP